MNKDIMEKHRQTFTILEGNDFKGGNPEKTTLHGTTNEMSNHVSDIWNAKYAHITDAGNYIRAFDEAGHCVYDIADYANEEEQDQ